jgi:hypothetical protein
VALRSAQDKEDLRIAMTTRNLIGQAQGSSWSATT